jgi:hypothetical protein
MPPPPLPPPETTTSHAAALAESGLKLLRAKDLDDAAKQAVAGQSRRCAGWVHASDTCLCSYEAVSVVIGRVWC